MKFEKYINNPRNFPNDISNKKSFTDLKNAIKNKILETLFDDNSLFSSNAFNYFCSNELNYSFETEGKNIIKEIDSILNNITDNINLKDQLNTDINTNYKLKKVRSRFSYKCKTKEKKKQISESEDDKSSSFGSKQTKVTQIEDKQKFNIYLMNNNSLINLFNSIEDGKFIDIDIKIANNLDKENAVKKIKSLNTNEKEKIKCEDEKLILKKNVCIKLYKALSFALKKLNFSTNEVKKICLYIEKKARSQDNNMGIKYKDYVKNILKKLSL